jgi:hypothetical protein
MSAYTRKTIRGSASALQNELNKLANSGALHEVWNLGTTADPEDIELNLELNKVVNPPAGGSNITWLVISSQSTRIDNIENELRATHKYISTEHRMPLHNEKERSVAVITVSK